MPYRISSDDLELVRFVFDALTDQPRRTQRIADAYYGVTIAPLKVSEIAAVEDLSKARIYQILRKAQGRLRKRLLYFGKPIPAHFERRNRRKPSPTLPAVAMPEEVNATILSDFNWKVRVAEVRYLTHMSNYAVSQKRKALGLPYVEIEEVGFA